MAYEARLVDEHSLALEDNYLGDGNVREKTNQGFTLGTNSTLP